MTMNANIRHATTKAAHSKPSGANPTTVSYMLPKLAIAFLAVDFAEYDVSAPEDDDEVGQLPADEHVLEHGQG